MISADVPRRLSRAFTILEAVAALTILALVILLVAQLGVWSLTQRGRNRDRHAAYEHAANILEEARAVSWDDLTPQWAALRCLPTSLSERGWRLSVEVIPESGMPQIKRVAVEIQPVMDNGQTLQPIRMVSLFSARSLRTGGGKP
jgi:type II secretory pathway pseudopilin PulG